MAYNFPMQKQPKNSAWCWAAVTVSVVHYFRPSSNLQMCDVAALLFPGKDCCKDRGPCDTGERLDVALNKVGMLREMLPDRTLTFQGLKSELDQDRPVCARIRWFGGGGHFVVLSGYRVLQGGGQQVVVSDPLLTDPIIVGYDEFRVAYNGDGEWTDTYLVQDGG
jgi:hypothetical protein